MAKVPSLIEMLQAGLHFGHSTSRWHPKMADFIFGDRSGIHIIDLEKTQKHLESSLQLIKDVTSRGGNVLFVGTKSQAKGVVKKYAEACAMPYVNERWLGGTLTNFKQIKISLKRLKTLKDQREKGELKKYTKKEQILIAREILDMDRKIGGIEDMARVPELVFIVDIRNEKTALKEAMVTKTKIVAMCDTNVNPTGVDAIIPANDDAVKSIELVCKLVCDAVKEGKAGAAKTASDKKHAETVKAAEKTV
jgi:small subunit ribosomal protein S2